MKKIFVLLVLITGLHSYGQIFAGTGLVAGTIYHDDWGIMLKPEFILSKHFGISPYYEYYFIQTPSEKLSGFQLDMHYYFFVKHKLNPYPGIGGGIYYLKKSENTPLESIPVISSRLGMHYKLGSRWRIFIEFWRSIAISFMHDGGWGYNLGILYRFR